MKITDNRYQTKAIKAVRATIPPTTPPAMGAILEEEPLLGVDLWVDETTKEVEVTRTVWTTTEPLGNV